MHYQPSLKSAADVSIDSLSRDGIVSSTIQGSSPGSNFQEKNEIIGSKTLPHIHSRSLSSKQSPSQDSDIWHSESEANWTMVDNNPFKDITQSQVLSEDEAKQVESCSRQSAAYGQANKDTTCVVTEKECTEHRFDSVRRSNHVGDHVAYGFEPPRSNAVFGSCSWNSLCLAVNSNILQESKGTVHADIDITFIIFLYLHMFMHMCT